MNDIFEESTFRRGLRVGVCTSSVSHSSVALFREQWKTLPAQQCLRQRSHCRIQISCKSCATTDLLALSFLPVLRRATTNFQRTATGSGTSDTVLTLSANETKMLPFTLSIGQVAVASSGRSSSLCWLPDSPQPATLDAAGAQHSSIGRRVTPCPSKLWPRESRDGARGRPRLHQSENR